MASKRTGRGIIAGVLLAAALTPQVLAANPDRDDMLIENMPEGYNLQAYDDCGVLELQPHVQNPHVYMFSTHEVRAGEKARSITDAPGQVNVLYDTLASQEDYVLAVTYATEPFNARVQSLWAGSVCLHGARPLPKGKAERLLLRVPRAAIRDGKLALQFKQEGPVNAVVSAIELWATAPSPRVLHLAASAAPYCDIEGRLLNLACDGVSGAVVQLLRSDDSKELATSHTASDGTFHFDRGGLNLSKDQNSELRLTAAYDGQTAAKTIQAQDLLFEPVRYRPMASVVGDLKEAQVSLDGTWRINLKPSDDLRKGSLDASGWSDIHVPGQWLEQGFNVPKDKMVAMAKEFEVPAAWQGYRVILRFNAIHAGTRYHFNGRPLGYSENLFTPVEWDITDTVRPGERNRLDLEMKVDTVSEQLSFSSDYASHSLGGIDRSVCIFAVPQVHIRSLHVATALDADYRDADLKLDLALDNTRPEPAAGFTLDVRLSGPDGKAVHHSVSQMEIGAVPPGIKMARLATHIANPLKWNAEQPNLYRLALALKQDGRVIERIERQVGFRKVELKDRQLYVNGVRVKLAGVCRHEIDPLTGRANTMAHAEEDVRLFKSANLNLIRTSHYPPTQELLDAADRLGMYVECEAPFCWVNERWGLAVAKQVLTPTSAMVDYNHVHPSIIYWSLANESSLGRAFGLSNRMVKELDPTRPTTFNNPDPKKVCDIANLHYPPMPYDEQFKDDPRTFIVGECHFEVYHERTDVAIDPGLREFWAHGSAEPDSVWGKYCVENFTKGMLLPGVYPGAWSHIYNSKRYIGNVIWSGVDDVSFLPGGKAVSSENNNAYWGLVDGWRRPKPELWYSKLVFSPVWFPARHVDYTPGQTSVRVPVENRYSFTDLSGLDFSWRLGSIQGKVAVNLAPGTKGELQLPVPDGTPQGSKMILCVSDRGGQVINTLPIYLGTLPQTPLPKPDAGAPSWREEDGKIIVEGQGFSLVLDRATGDFDTANPGHHAPLLRFPALHVTRHDYGDLGRAKKPYAEFPDAKTRQVEAVTVSEKPEGLEIIVKDRYESFAGSVHWLIDKKGLGEVTSDYLHTGDDLETRETGVEVLLRGECDKIVWRRWSEWDIFPDDHISRTEGSAKARRDAKWGPVDAPASVRPSWPWSLDQTELGTNDFRSIKFNIYEASLAAPDGAGIRVRANADVHVRSCLTAGGVKLHLLSQCPLGPAILHKGSRLRGSYVIELLR